jgi:hypothetical protein
MQRQDSTQSPPLVPQIQHIPFRSLSNMFDRLEVNLFSRRCGHSDARYSLI